MTQHAFHTMHAKTQFVHPWGRATTSKLVAGSVNARAQKPCFQETRKHHHFLVKCFSCPRAIMLSMRSKWGALLVLDCFPYLFRPTCPSSRQKFLDILTSARCTWTPVVFVARLLPRIDFQGAHGVERLFVPFFTADRFPTLSKKYTIIY